jgi:MFS family permease
MYLRCRRVRCRLNAVGLSPSIQALAATGAVRGAAAALLIPGEPGHPAIIVHPADRMHAIGAWTGALSVATASGHLVGGWFVGHNWRWAFGVNVPFCVVFIVPASRYVPESRNPSASHTIDVRESFLAHWAIRPGLRADRLARSRVQWPHGRQSGSEHADAGTDGTGASADPAHTLEDRPSAVAVGC